MSARFSECWDFVRTGTCPRGERCKWDHNPSSEVEGSVAGHRATPPDPSDFCWNYMRTGRCPRGSKCGWIHDLILVPGSYLGPGPAYPPSYPSAIPHKLAPISTSIDDSVNWSLELPTTPDSYWDRASENRGMFGGVSSYDPSMPYYTTHVPISGLTSDQIREAEELTRIPLPSGKLSIQPVTECSFCHEGFKSLEGLKSHLARFLKQSDDTESHDPGDRCLKGVRTFLKRKSWIVTQETLPNGLVSQIEGIYTRQITSSTNLQMIVDCIYKCAEVDHDTREYLINEFLSIVILGLPNNVPREGGEDGKISSTSQVGRTNRVKS